MILSVAINHDERKLDSILKMRYGNGIVDFDLSLMLVHEYFLIKTKSDILKFIQTRKHKLNDIRNNLIENIDDYLNGINFYNKYHSSAKLKWTTDNKYNFIVKSYFLRYFNLFIIKQIYLYEKWEKQFSPTNTFPFSNDISRISSLKPISLIVLAWAPIFKRKSKIDWKNLEMLLRWYAINKPGLLKLVNIKKYNIPSSESLRASYNKNKKSKIRLIASLIFKVSFSQVDRLIDQLEQLKKNTELLPEQYKKHIKELLDNDIIDNSFVI